MLPQRENDQSLQKKLNGRKRKTDVAVISLCQLMHLLLQALPCHPNPLSHHPSLILSWTLLPQRLHLAPWIILSHQRRGQPLERHVLSSAENHFCHTNASLHRQIMMPLWTGFPFVTNSCTPSWKMTVGNPVNVTSVQVPTPIGVLIALALLSSANPVFWQDTPIRLSIALNPGMVNSSVNAIFLTLDM
jgi:hypothetical protein